MNNDLRFANAIRTKRSKSLIIFLSVMLLTTIIFIVLIAILEKTSGLAILGYIMCGAFNLIALFLLISALTDFVEVNGEMIITQTLFVRKKAKIVSISKITHEKNFYVIYINDKPFTSLNDRDPETSKMLFRFEKMGINIGKIEWLITYQNVWKRVIILITLYIIFYKDQLIGGYYG